MQGGNIFWIVLATLAISAIMVGARPARTGAVRAVRNVAGPVVTDVVKFYTLTRDETAPIITAEELGWLRQGSADEEDRASIIPLHSLVDWATNQERQAAYGKRYGNQTWQKAVASYLKGDRQSAFIALGHVLRLIQYASLGSSRDNRPRFRDENKTSAADNLLRQGRVPFAFYSLAQAFNRLADLTAIPSRQNKEPANDKALANAVRVGAGVIRLFFSETQRYRLHPDLVEPIAPDVNEPLFQAIKHAPAFLAIKLVRLAGGSFVDSNVLAHRLTLTVAANLEPATGGIILPPRRLAAHLAAKPALDSATRREIIAAIEPFGVVEDKKFILPEVIDETPITKMPITPAPAPAVTFQQPVVGLPQPAENISAPAQPPAQSSTQSTAMAAAPTNTLPTNGSLLLGLQNIQNAQTPLTPGAAAGVATSAVPATDQPPAPLTAPVSLPVADNATAPTGASTTTPPDNILPVTASSSTPDYSSSADQNIVTDDASVDPVDLSTDSATTTADNTPANIVPAYIISPDAIPNDNASSTDHGAATSTPGMSFSRRAVIINEVAWAGTNRNHPNDQWLELYNNTDQPIDLTNWHLTVSGRPLSWQTIVTSTIPAHGFFLLEGERMVLRDVDYDIIYHLDNGLNKAGEKLELRDPSNALIDLVDCSAGWFAGSAEQYRTMERRYADKNGNATINWQTNIGARITGRAIDGGTIYGSPKRPTRGFLALAGQQEERERTLTKADSPYILGGYIIPAGDTLTIEPGVVIKSYYSRASLDIYGKLSASGTAAAPIVFTSGRDHSFKDASDNQTVGDWPGPEPQPKDWQGLWFHPNSHGSLRHVSIRYAGHEFQTDHYIYRRFVSEALRADQSRVTVRDSAFDNNGDAAVHLEDATSTIADATFDGGGLAVEALNSRVRLHNADFRNFTNPQGTVYVKDRWPKMSGLKFNNNASNMPWLDHIYLTVTTTIGEGTPILFSGLEVPKSVKLTIKAGARLFLAPGTSFDIKGSLDALGTATKNITFAALTKDPLSLWDYLHFSGASSIMRYVDVSGGNRLSDPIFNGMFVVEKGQLTCDHCNLHDSRAPGNSILASDSTITLIDSIIGQTAKVLYQATGIHINRGLLRLIRTTFRFVTTALESGGVSLPSLDISGLTADNFRNVDQLSAPLSWLKSLADGTIASSTTPQNP